MAKKNTKGALTPPPSAKTSNWTVKIARAKEAREGAQKVRAGKPVSFPTHLVRP